MSREQSIGWEQIERLPLFALHAMLARYEATIDERLREVGGEMLARWESVQTPEDVRRIYGVKGAEATYYHLAILVQKREAEELARLRAEAA